MEKNNIRVNDVLEALAIRLNDVLRPDKKNKNKKNNAYFWVFKCILLMILIMIINIIFNSFSDLGVAFVYAFAKSLRSVLSLFWVRSLSFIKGLLILYLLYDNLKVFTSSEYYSNLYQKERKLKYKKELVFNVIEIILKVFAVFAMIGIAFIGAISVFGLVMVFIMLSRNIYIISPIVICLSTLLISFFTFMHIRNRFFGKTQTITKNHFLTVFIMLILGVLFFGYELSSYEYYSGFPDDMKLITKEQVFKLEENKKIKLKSNTRLDNLKIIYDSTLEDKMIVKLQYFETADVRYTYTFNEYDDLDLTFSSKLDFKPENVNDVFKLIYSTFNRKIKYNYNLFKYPNIYVYVNPKYKSFITVD